MNRPKPHIRLENEIQKLPHIVISVESQSGWASVIMATAKTKATAYKRAAAKLRKLADEAERLAEES